MIVTEFWAKTGKILEEHLGKFAASNLTGDSQYENISAFLQEMDALSSEWYNHQSDEEIKRREQR